MSNAQQRLEDRTHAELQREMASRAPGPGQEDLSRKEYLDKLTKHGLDDRTAEYVENMLSPDFVLSKITKAEKEEMRWLVRQQAEKIKAMHPTHRSPVTGDRRAALYGDQDAVLKPLTDRQIQLLEMAVWDVFFRVARSVEGWQQKELSSQYNVSRVDNDREESSSRLGGLFS